jgi:predicted secreted protein
MASNAISGIGTVIKRGDGASVEFFTTIAEVNGISNWSRTRDTYEVTTLDSPNGYKEFISGFRDPGGFTLNMNFTRATYEQMVVDFENDNAVNYRIVLGDASLTQYDFAAMITDLAFDSTTSDRITSNCTFKVTGPPTMTS